LPIEQLQLRAIRKHSHPVTGSEADYAPMMDLIGNSRFVLIDQGPSRVVSAGDLGGVLADTQHNLARHSNTGSAVHQSRKRGKEK
jgi:hypothetical protein